VSIRVSDRIHVGSSGPWRVREGPTSESAPRSARFFLPYRSSPRSGPSRSRARARGEPVTRDYFDASRSIALLPGPPLTVTDSARLQIRIIEWAYATVNVRRGQVLAATRDTDYSSAATRESPAKDLSRTATERSRGQNERDTVSFNKIRYRRSSIIRSVCFSEVNFEFNLKMR